MDLGIKGLGALVLGGSGGLGRAAAVALGSEGVNVAVVGRNSVELGLTVAAIRRVGGEAHALTPELGNTDAIVGGVGEAAELIGPIQILVNNTGGPPRGLATGRAPHLWAGHFNAMVLSITAVTDAVFPEMRRLGFGRIITSTSSGVIAPIENLAISNTMRSALVGWSKTLAREAAPFGVTANVVVPGRIQTRRTKDLDQSKAERLGKSLEDVENGSIATIAVGRFGTPEEYGSLVAFLASKRASLSRALSTASTAGWL
jgi:3-oxoacyl-[acyl-carrier protein] reductase